LALRAGAAAPRSGVAAPYTIGRVAAIGLGWVPERAC